MIGQGRDATVQEVTQNAIHITLMNYSQHSLQYLQKHIPAGYTVKEDKIFSNQ